MKKRWLCLFVENEPGVLARISGLFSGKSYNLNSLTVGVTEDDTVSRMTISLTGDDKTFEQIKKQLNRSVEVIRVVDYTDAFIHLKEVLFIKINNCTESDKIEVFRISEIFGAKITDYDCTDIILECMNTENKNNELIRFLKNSLLIGLKLREGEALQWKQLRDSLVFCLFDIDK